MLCLRLIHGNANIIKVIFVCSVAAPVSNYITIGCTATGFPPLHDSKPVREPGVEAVEKAQVLQSSMLVREI